MEEYIVFFILMTIIGALGSGLGGIISGVLRIDKNYKISIIMNITSGIMTGIVCLDMIPESININNKNTCLLGIIIGTILVLFVDIIVSSYNKNNSNMSNFIVMISMAFHNIIEGIAIGCSFSYSYVLGINVLISIILHDIPEGMVVGVTNKIDKIKFKNVVFNSSLVGAFMGIGALIGKISGNLSNEILSFGLSLAGGAMLYVVSCNLIPDSNKLTVNKYIMFFYIIGIILSMIVFFN